MYSICIKYVCVCAFSLPDVVIVYYEMCVKFTQTFLWVRLSMILAS